MVTPGTHYLHVLRTLAGPEEGAGLRLVALGGVVVVGLLLWGLLVFALGTAWPRAAQVLTTLLLAGLTGAACFAVLRQRQR